MKIIKKSFLTKFKNNILGYLYSISKMALLQQQSIALKNQKNYIEKISKEFTIQNEIAFEKLMQTVTIIQKDIPEFNKKLINYVFDRLKETQEYVLELQNHNRLLWVENKRLENFIILHNIPITSIIPEVQPLVIIEDYEKISRSFTSYDEEGKRILLTLMVKPSSIEDIATNASITKNKVKLFIKDILNNGNRINNKFGKKFKIIKYFEGEEPRFMLLYANIPTVAEAEKIDIDIID